MAKASNGKRTMMRPVHMLCRPGQVAKLTLADGFRFIILVRNEPPTVIPIFEQGTYSIDIPDEMSRGKWPVGIMTVDLADVPLLQKVPAATVTRMLDAAAQQMEKGNG
jgi:hypothetical protein